MQQSMFERAQNFTINNGRFTNIHSGSEEAPPERAGVQYGLHLLRQNSSLAARLDSSERFDAPRCDEDTRTAVIHDIMSWISNDDQRASMTWIYGSAGAGKSALGQSIAELCAKEGQLAGCFFFSRLLANRNNGNKVVATLALQLAEYFPEIRSRVAKSVVSQSDIFQRTNSAQMQHLIVNHVKNIRRPSWYYFLKFIGGRKQPRLFVIDGLDECSSKEIQRDILLVISKAIQELKFPFRFIVCSRPEPQILDTFNRILILKDSRRVSRLDLDELEETRSDIELYIRKRFKEIKKTHCLASSFPSEWPSEHAIRKIVQNSSSHFIYATVVMKYIEASRHNPVKSLEIILGLSPTPTNESPFAPIDALYTHIFSSTEHPEQVKEIFSCLVIPRTEDDGLGKHDTPEMLDTLLFYEPGKARLILNDLLCIVKINNKTPNMPVKLLHATLSDFLLDPRRSRECHVDVMKGHQLLARGYLALLKDQSHPPLARYLVNFLLHFQRTFFSAELRHELEGFDFFKTYYDCQLPNVNALVPYAVTKEYGSASLAAFVPQKWEHLLSGTLELFIHLIFQEETADIRQEYTNRYGSPSWVEYYLESIGYSISAPPVSTEDIPKWTCHGRTVKGHLPCDGNSKLPLIMHVALQETIWGYAERLAGKSGPSHHCDLYFSTILECLQLCQHISVSVVTRMKKTPIVPISGSDSEFHSDSEPDFEYAAPGVTGDWLSSVFCAALDRAASALRHSTKPVFDPNLIKLLVVYKPRNSFMRRYPSLSRKFSDEIIKYIEYFSAQIPPHDLALIRKASVKPEMDARRHR